MANFTKTALMLEVWVFSGKPYHSKENRIDWIQDP